MSRLNKFELFREVKKFAKQSNFKMSLILRNLPGGFVEKNYLCLVVGLP